MSTYPMMTLSAPKGVMRIAGAKEYAAKLAISPAATKKKEFKQKNVHGTKEKEA